MPRTLLALDFTNIKGYVFATDRLREIRGASALLDRISRLDVLEAARRVASARGVEPPVTWFLGGGAGLLSVDAAIADEAAAQIRQVALDQTAAVDVRTALLPEPDLGPISPDDREAFKQVYRALGARLQVRKAENPAVWAPHSHALQRWCESCGAGESVDERPDPDGFLRSLCAACSLRWDENGRVHELFQKDEWGRSRSETSSASQGLWQRLHDQMVALGDTGLTNTVLAEDFDKLAEQGGDGRSLAVLYADGDGLGTLLEGSGSFPEVRRRSAAVEEALYGALARAAAAPPGEARGPLAPDRSGRERVMLPFNVLLLGGDDLVLATTPDRAFRAASDIARAFHRAGRQDATGNRLPKDQRLPLSLSVGVAVAQATYPFRALLALAEGALRSAKQHRFFRIQDGVLPEDGPGLISHVVVSSTTHTDFATYERDQLFATETMQPARRGPPLNVRIARTLRPYTPDELDLLLTQARTAAALPLTRVEGLRATAFQPIIPAIVDGRGHLARMREGQRATALSSMRALADTRTVDFPWLCTRAGDEPIYVNPWADLAELAPYAALPADAADTTPTTAEVEQ